MSSTLTNSCRMVEHGPLEWECATHGLYVKNGYHGPPGPPTWCTE